MKSINTKVVYDETATVPLIKGIQPKTQYNKTWLSCSEEFDYKPVGTDVHIKGARCNSNGLRLENVFNLINNTMTSNQLEEVARCFYALSKRIGKDNPCE